MQRTSSRNHSLPPQVRLPWTFCTSSRSLTAILVSLLLFTVVYSHLLNHPMTGDPSRDAESTGHSAQEPGSPREASSGSTRDLETNFAREVVQQCEAVVTDFRAGRIDKPTAVVRLLEAFAFERSPSAEETTLKRSAFQAFSQQLDKAEEDARRAAQRGGQVGTGAHSTAESPEDGPLPTDSREVEQRQSTRRAHDSDDSDADAADEPPRKKKQVDESMFPFGHSGAASTLAPELQKTLLLKANYLRDVSSTKQSILVQPDVPSLPDSLWNDVIKNDYVELDKIFASIHSIKSEPKQILKFGELELEAAVPRIERHITQHGEWTVAWGRYEKAVVYLYPHRLSELREYFEYVTGLFTSVDRGREWRVINYDKAVRREVGESNAFLLTDFGRFNRHFSKFLVGSGGGTQSSSSQAEGSSRSNKSPSSEVCRKFNDQRCSSKQCRYRHVCSDCGGRDHAVTACPRQVSEKPHSPEKHAEKRK